MALSKAQKKVMNDLLLLVAALRVRVKKEMKEALIYSIAMHKLNKELKAAHIAGLRLLRIKKPRV